MPSFLPTWEKRVFLVSQTISPEIISREFQEDFNLWEQEFSLCAVEARELEVDALLQKRASSLIGGIALETLIDTEPVAEFDIESNVPSNLAEALDRARSGDVHAEKMIRSNVTTDYLERAYKFGFVSEVELEKRPDGEIVQYGQSIEKVHVNSLVYIGNEKMKQRAKIETLNSVRDKHYVNTGLLKDNARVTVSLVHEDMSDEEAEEVGFFVPTKSISIQVMTEREDGQLVIQSAFVAGRENQSDEPFDKLAVVELARMFGVDYQGQTTEQILSRPWLVDKKLLPDLSVSVVERFDEAAEAVTGKKKFFGRDIATSQKTHNYIEKAQKSKQIASEMKHDIDKVVQDLILFRTDSPTAATEKLAELNDELVKRRIVADTSIDARVLGIETAYHVEHARALIRIDAINQQQLQREMSLLQLKINEGSSNSCPGGASNRKNSLEGDMFASVNDINDEQTDSDSKMTEDCEFISKECPKCGEKNVKTECKKGVYYGDCGCSSDGKTSSKASNSQFAKAA